MVKEILMEITPMFILGCINLLLIIIVGAFNWFSHNKIVYNDLHHLSTDVKKLVERQEVISEKVNTLGTDLSFLKGKFDVYTSTKTFKKSKKILNKV
jgi:hypothetical protein